MKQSRRISMSVGLWLCTVLAVPVYAQGPVSGKVTGIGGAPLPGVSVLIQGTSDGVTTDTEGLYRLNDVAPDASLVFRFIGYSPQEHQVNGRTTINVQLEEDAATLEEVVVIGFGTQKKATLTGA